MNLLEKLSLFTELLAKLPKRKDWVVVISFLINPISFLCFGIGTKLNLFIAPFVLVWTPPFLFSVSLLALGTGLA